MDSYISERKHLKISLAFVITLMIWGLVFNELTDSNIVELDAGSYVISGIIGLITIYVSRLQERPETDTHPLGYSGFVPILNLIRNLMIILIAIKAIGESIGSLASGPPVPEHGVLFLYAGVTLLLNTSCFIYLKRVSGKLKSDLLRTDALEWKIDTVSNVSILAAFGLSYALEKIGYDLASHYIDPVVCILFSVYMCWGPGQLFIENVQQLSVTSIDKKTQDVLISKISQAHPLLSANLTHFTVVNIAGVLWVNLEIETDNKFETQELMHAAACCQKILDEVSPKNKLSYQLFDRLPNEPSRDVLWQKLKNRLWNFNA